MPSPAAVTIATMDGERSVSLIAASVTFSSTRGADMTFTSIDVEHGNSVATIKIKPFERTQREGANHTGYVDVHTAIAEALETLRWEDSVRIIVITGSEDGEFYWAPGPG